MQYRNLGYDCFGIIVFEYFTFWSDSTEFLPSTPVCIKVIIYHFYVEKLTVKANFSIITFNRQLNIKSEY